jgi:ketosteroid isomerase-like protein
MPAEKIQLNDNKKIRKIIDDFFFALSKKDIKGMMSAYANDVVVFDVKPPFQTKGAVALKHIWEASLPFFPEVFQIEMRDLVITTGSNLAIAHYLFRLTGLDKNHPAMQTWLRITTAFKLQDRRWKIIHEHGSLPYNPQTMQAVLSLEVE